MYSIDLQTPTSAFIKPVIENELDFLTVNRNLLPFESISVFIGKTGSERLPVSQGKDGNKFRNDFLLFIFQIGSGYYELTLSDQDIVNVEYDGIKNEIVIKPLRIGRVSFFFVESLCKLRFFLPIS